MWVGESTLFRLLTMLLGYNLWWKWLIQLFVAPPHIGGF